MGRRVTASPNGGRLKISYSARGDFSIFASTSVPLVVAPQRLAVVILAPAVATSLVSAARVGVPAS